MMMMMMSVITRRLDVCYNDLWVSLFQVFNDREVCVSAEYSALY